MATFICGATGTQGGALASVLLSHSQPVRCLARTPSAPAAQSLTTRGATVVPGSYDDTAALTEALKGCTSAFLNFMPEFTDFSAELRWAKSILTIAGQQGVKHVVYSSSFGVGDPKDIPGLPADSMTGMILLSKHNIEKEVKKAEHVPSWTILRPGYFMANFINPFAQMMVPGLLSPTGTWSVAYRTDMRIPLTDTTTVGNFSASAILYPEKFSQKTISYCDEISSFEEILESLRAATGRSELNVEFMDEDEVQRQMTQNPFVQGQVASRDMAKEVTMEEVEAYGVKLSTFEGFLEREKANVAQTFGVTA